MSPGEGRGAGSSSGQTVAQALSWRGIICKEAGMDRHSMGPHVENPHWSMICVAGKWHHTGSD